MYKNILVPVLFDEGHDSTASYAAARALAGKDTKFTVLHVLETIPTYAMLEIPTQMLEDSRAAVEASLAKAAKELGGKPALITGYPGRAIVDYATENDIDCIVMASHKLGFSDIFLGSTAAKVVRHAKCSVHVIR